MSILFTETEVLVKFNEVDSLSIVWHGHYLRYFEDAREAFGLEYGMGYLDIHRQGFIVPVVKVVCDYKKPLMYGDTAIVKAEYVDCAAAKLMFRYEIRRKSNLDIIATGETVQVLLNENREMALSLPEFINEWKLRHKLR